MVSFNKEELISVLVITKIKMIIQTFWLQIESLLHQPVLLLGLKSGRMRSTAQQLSTLTVAAVFIWGFYPFLGSSIDLPAPVYIYDYYPFYSCAINEVIDPEAMAQASSKFELIYSIFDNSELILGVDYEFICFDGFTDPPLDYSDSESLFMIADEWYTEGFSSYSLRISQLLDIDILSVFTFHPSDAFHFFRNIEWSIYLLIFMVPIATGLLVGQMAQDIPKRYHVLINFGFYFFQGEIASQVPLYRKVYWNSKEDSLNQSIENLGHLSGAASHDSGLPFVFPLCSFDPQSFGWNLVDSGSFTWKTFSMTWPQSGGSTRTMTCFGSKSSLKGL